MTLLPSEIIKHLLSELFGNRSQLRSWREQGVGWGAEKAFCIRNTHESFLINQKEEERPNAVNECLDTML